MSLNQALIAALAIALSGGACGDLDGGIQPTQTIECTSDSRHLTLPEAPRPLAQSETRAWLSGRALAVSGERIYAVDELAGELVLMDRASLRVEQRVPVGERPEQVVVGPEGVAWVSVRHGASIARVTPEGDVTAFEVGVEPYGLALSLDGATLYATLSGSAELLVIDASGAIPAVLQRIPTGATPRSVAVSPRGWLAVVHQYGPARTFELEGKGAIVESSARSISLRRGNPWQVGRTGIVGQYNATRAFAAAPHPESGAILIAHVQVSPGSVDNPVDSYGVPQVDPELGVALRPVELTTTTLLDPSTTAQLVPELPIVDAGATSGTPVLTHLFDQPVDIHHHPTWSLAFVVAEGTDNVLVLNTALDDPMRAPVARIQVGRAPVALAFSTSGDRAYVLNAHDHTVGEIVLAPLFGLEPGVITRPDKDDPFCNPLDPRDPLSASGPLVQPTAFAATRSAPFGEDPSDESVRRGRRIFTYAGDPKLSHAGQFACATCHSEGTEDKQTWFVDGVPRQTPSLAGRLADTAPYNWEGTKDELATNMDQTIERLGGLGLGEGEKADLEAYLTRGLVPPPNPYLDPAGLTPEQLHGQALFEDPIVGCATCHGGDALTDGRSHAIELAGEETAPTPLNTPSLRGLYYTAPYLHDGRAATLREALELTATTMGHTADLSEAEIDALVAYLLTL